MFNRTFDFSEYPVTEICVDHLQSNKSVGKSADLMRRYFNEKQFV